MTSAQVNRALHLIGQEVARLRAQAPRYRELKAEHDGERVLNEDQARLCEDDADALEAVMELVVSMLPRS